MTMDLREAVDRLLSARRRSGATAIEITAVEGESLEVGVRLGKVETLKRARERRLAVRAFAGCSSAICSTADISGETLDHLLEEAVRLARVTAEDPFSGIPDPEGQPIAASSLLLYDPSASVTTAEEALEVALRAERAALDVDPRIDNSEGAAFEIGTQQLLYATSKGFAGEYETSSFSLSVIPVARDQTGMQQDYWYSAARRRADLDSPEEVGKTAAQRVLRRLDPRTVHTCEVPVVFDPQTAASLLGHVASAVSGTSVYRNLSFLRGRLDDLIAHESLTVVDDPHLPARLGSRPFDAEGLATRSNVVIEAGHLRSYLLDTYAARKLGLATTASAVRTLGDAPTAGPTNLYVRPGDLPPHEIIGQVQRGFFVTELSGFGVNPVTGDYSRGASGLWIENGELAFAVEGVTIAGNLLEMLHSIEVIGNDLSFRTRIASPTIRIGKLTVGGE